MSFPTVERALADIRAGKMVVLVDDQDRENEGDLCMAAELTTPASVNFMARYGRGLICLALEDARLRQLDLPMMVEHNTSRYGTAFTVSIEARHGVTTGISAADRAHTIVTALRDDARPEDLVRPGHIFPLRAQPGGVLVRVGQTEGSVDLARLAGLKAGAVICEIMNDDGTMARMPDLIAFAKTHDLTIVSIADLIRYRLAHESLVRRVATATLTHARWGTLSVHAYTSGVDTKEHLVVVKGDVLGDPPPLVRMHTGCALCDVFGDLFCSCGTTVYNSLRQIHGEGRGVLVYLLQEHEGTSLHDKIDGIARGTMTPAGPAEGTDDETRQSYTLRRYGIGAQILRELGLTHIRLLAHHQFKMACLEGFGLAIDQVVPIMAADEQVVNRLHAVND